MNRINIDRLAEELSAILSEKYGVEIILRAIPKEEALGKVYEEDYCEESS